LGGASAKGVAEGAGEVTNLANVHAYIWIKGTGGNCEGVPLGSGNGRDVEQKPLARFVTQARFGELDLERIVRVADDFGDLCRAAGADFAVNSFNQIDTASPKFPAPAFIAKAMTPEGRASERGDWVFGISYKAASCMGVEGEQERDEEVVGVPEGFV